MTSALAALCDSGIRTVMLTGDNKTTAQAIADKLGIIEIEAEVLLADKTRIVERLRAEGRVVAMAGDGVNDAPDVAMGSAGITLLRGYLIGIVRARALSKEVMSNIRQKSVLRLHLQHSGLAHRRWHPLPVSGFAAVAHDRRRGNGALIGPRHRQRLEAANSLGLTTEFS